MGFYSIFVIGRTKIWILKCAFVVTSCSQLLDLETWKYFTPMPSIEFININIFCILHNKYSLSSSLCIILVLYDNISTFFRFLADFDTRKQNFIWIISIIQLLGNSWYVLRFSNNKLEYHTITTGQSWFRKVTVQTPQATRQVNIMTKKDRHRQLKIIFLDFMWIFVTTSS